jgi:hypothetical protein
MPNLRASRNSRGFYVMKKKIAFADKVMFEQGAGLLPARTIDFFVDGKDGSDNFDGLSMDQPKATVAAAVTAMNARIDWSETPWARADNLYIAPGVYAENLTALPYGCKIIGLGHDVRDAQAGVKIKPASGLPVSVTSCINSAFYNIGFESVDTSAAFATVNCNNVLFEGCFFSGAAEATTAVYAFYASDVTKATFRDSWFCNADNGFYVNYVDGGDKLAYLLMEDCMITGCSATGIYVSTQLVGVHNVVRHNTIIGGGQTLAIGIDDNIACIDESFNCIEATTAVDGVRSSNGSYGNGVLLT